MLSCLQEYLQNGLSKQCSINLNRKKLIQETNIDFVNWIDQLVREDGFPEGRIRKDVFMSKFIDQYPDFKSIQNAKFSKWLCRWAQEHNIKVDCRTKLEGKMAFNFEKSVAVRDSKF